MSQVRGIRIAGGTLKGRKLKVPDQGTRPTSIRVRESIFNQIQFEIQEARVLDLFAGSGALGFEALSWGASKAIFVESSKKAASRIRENAKELGVEQRIEVMEEGALESLQRFPFAGVGPFRFVFADPPYEAGWEEKLLEEVAWKELLTGKLFLESSHKTAVPDQTRSLRKTRQKRYGDTFLTTYEVLL